MKKTITLKNRFILTSYLSIVCSIILIIIISFVLLSHNSRKYTIRANNEIVSQNCDAIDLQLDGLERTLRDIIYSERLQELLRQYHGSLPGGSYEFRISMNQTISGMTNALYLFDNLAVLSPEGEMLGSMLGFELETSPEASDWFRAFSQTQGETLWLTEEAFLDEDTGDRHYVVPAVKKIRSIGSQDDVELGEELGYLYVLVHLDNVLNFPQKPYIPTERKIFIVDQDGTVIGGSQADAFGSAFPLASLKDDDSCVPYGEGKYLAAWRQIKNPALSWYVVCLTPRASIFKEAYVAIAICLLISIVLLVVFLLISFHNANALSRPIQDLEGNFEMVEQGDFRIKIRERTNIAEIDRLFSRFHVMAYRLDTLIHEVYEAKLKEQKLIADVTKAEIQTLQMQINPHFLYNTLDSINWMALMEGNEEVSRMVLALGQLFRANMNTTGIYTTIEEEIGNLELFLYLEQVRFDEKLKYRITASEDVSSCRIVKHLLQPLVENSIKYGIERYNRKELIEVLVEKKEERISITVADNGNGVRPDKLEEIRRLWEERQSVGILHEGNKDGIGLINVMKRLYLCYGNEAEFFIKSSQEEGTKTIISYPAGNLPDYVG